MPNWARKPKPQTVPPEKKATAEKIQTDPPVRRRTIAKRAFAILEAVEFHARTTKEIRSATGSDPHPALTRDVIARGWAIRRPDERIEVTMIGLAALNLGRLERTDQMDIENEIKGSSD